MSPPRKSDFEIGVICALTLEGGAVEAVFDEIYEDIPNLPEVVKFGYTEWSLSLGRIGKKYIVVIWLREIGVKSAGVARVALQNVYTEINMYFVVGICGGVPLPSDTSTGPVLGDVIISTNILPHDIGKQVDETFVLTEKPYVPANITSFLNKQTAPSRKQKLESRLLAVLNEARSNVPEGPTRSTISYQGVEKDILYNPKCVHKHQKPCCEDGSCADAQRSTCAELGCDLTQVIPRVRLSDPKNPPKPFIHFGTVGSGNKVMKSGKERDDLAKRYQIIAFEMEGAGVYDDGLTVLVIKGICDYADGHKNKLWQPYAAYAAAGAFKALLEEYSSSSANIKIQLLDRVYSKPSYS